jgi:hypothetical protein
MNVASRLILNDITSDSMLFKRDEDIKLNMLSRSNMSDQFAQYLLE